MAKKMLIDATHAEETRVVVVDGNKVEEFDFESAARRQLAGSIYLAKVTRVEPSLQAAFVDYGGNRHGFLAFSEIHPDYYQIPIADREALMAEERAYAKSLADEAEAAERAETEKPKRRRIRSRTRAAKSNNSDVVITAEAETDAPSKDIAGMETIDLDGEQDSDLGLTVDAPMAQSSDDAERPVLAETPEDQPAEEQPVVEQTAQERPASEDKAEDTPAESADDQPAENIEAEAAVDETVVEVTEPVAEQEAPAADQPAEDAAQAETIETVAAPEEVEDIRPVRKPRPRRYKIQEVVKVRQVMLIQVVKEERGNKGAALTTYLSLAGRYCVLMPNTARGGGISRKITNAVDRKKLKEIANGMDVPEGAGLIIRTAGSQRTKTEIKRDYEYLQRLWEQVRELTLRSTAPAKIYEEGDLIKRSIRDLYSKEIDEVLVEGESGYRNAKDFMKMIMPSHAKFVKRYNDPMPLFARHQVEGYLSGMFNPTVQLPSGGYIVIGITEALVAIDVNSGRATKEASIEQTALKTNLEASDEVARQLRLRDLAGLIVIDYIDMDERKNNMAVEKRFKDKLKTDRARIQVGRISGFGLLEMSRQRLRPGMLEATTQPCSHCHGTGLLRSDDNVALAILRQLEEEGVRGRSREVLVRGPISIINFLMNHKREHIAAIEARYGMSVRLECDPSLISPDFLIEKFKTATRVVPEVTQAVVQVSAALMDDSDEEESAEATEVEAEAPETEAADAEQDENRPKRKRRRRRRRRGNGGAEGSAEDGAQNTAGEGTEADTDTVKADADETAPSDMPVQDDAAHAANPESDEAAPAAEEPAAKPKRRRSRRKKAEPVVEVEAGSEVEANAETSAVPSAEAEVQPDAEAEAPAKPKRRRSRKKPAAKAADEAEQAPVTEASVTEAAPVASAEMAEAVTAVEAVAEAAPAEATPIEAAPVEPAPAETAPVENHAEIVAEAAPVEAAPVEAVAEVVAEAPVEDAKPKRRGWWSITR
ncbi:MAG: Rne/Rng family ribonuclease [Rhodobacteraceae bacterium]|nr:Rne/Rng family ribonuclease [Paracoccaceae bacterium]